MFRLNDLTIGHLSLFETIYFQNVSYSVLATFILPGISLNTILY